MRIFAYINFTSMEFKDKVAVVTGEAPLEAAKRELLEETGYAGGVWQEWLTLSPNASANSNLVHCFVARDVEKVAEQDLDPTEDIAVSLHSEGFVRDLLYDGQVLRDNLRHKGRRITFVHGVGDGVLARPVRQELDEAFAVSCSYTVGPMGATVVIVK